MSSRFSDPMLVHHLWKGLYEEHRRTSGHANPSEHASAEREQDKCRVCYQLVKMAQIANEGVAK